MRRLACSLVLALALAACGGGSGGDNAAGTGDGGGSDDGGGGGTPPTDFTAFVKDLLANTSDTADPVDVNGLVLENLDNEDPTAFDDVLGP